MVKDPMAMMVVLYRLVRFWSIVGFYADVGDNKKELTRR